MKPAQLIQMRKKMFERKVADAAKEFSDETGGAIDQVIVSFINVTTLADDAVRTELTGVEVRYIL